MDYTKWTVENTFVTCAGFSFLTTNDAKAAPTPKMCSVF